MSLASEEKARAYKLYNIIPGEKLNLNAKHTRANNNEEDKKANSNKLKKLYLT